MTYLILAFIAGAVIGRLSKRRPVIRHSSSQYFHPRVESQPYVRRWDADAVRQYRNGGVM